MAATVGSTTFDNAGFPDRHANLGPFKSSGGNYYFFPRNTASNGNVRVQKATDPIGGSFSAVAGNMTMSSGSAAAIQAAACYQVGDVIHVATQISTGAVYYNNFNMATDAWGLATSELAVAAASQAPTTSTALVGLVVRSNGNVVIAYNAGQTAMSSTFNQWFYRVRTGTNTYGTATNITSGGSVNWIGGPVALGASDRAHFFYSSSTGQALYQRTLTSANALQASPASYAASTTNHVHGNAISYTSGGSTFAVALNTRVSATPNFAPHVAYLTSADAPTPTSQQVSDATPTSATRYYYQLASDGPTLHVLYSASTTQDLMHDTSTDGGATWGADTNELAATMNDITANVYDRSGTKLAMVIDDGGTLKYAEISLGAAAVNIAMDPATLASLGRNTTVTPGAVSRSMTLASLTSLGRNLTVTPGTVTRPMDPAALALLGRNLTVTPGSASFAMDAAALASLGRNLTLDTPLTLALDASALALAPQALSVTPGAVSMAQDVAALASLGQSAMILPGAVSAPLDAATLASAGYPLTIDQATIIALQSAVLASLGQAATIIPGAATLPLDAAALAGSGWPLTLVAGATTSQMGAGALAGSGWPLGLIPGAATSQMAAAILASAGYPLITGADILVGMQMAALVAQGQTLTSVAGGSVSLPMDAGALTALGRGFVVVPGAASAPMDAASLNALGRGLVVVPGATSVALDAALLALAGQGITIGTAGAAQSIVMALAVLASLGRPLTVVPGAAASQMDPASLTAAGQEVTVIPGAVTISTDAASLVLIAQGLTVETLTSVAMSAAELSGAARTLTVIPAEATVLLEAYTASLEALGLNIAIFAQETPGRRVFIVLAEDRFSRPVREARAMDVVARREALVAASDNRLLSVDTESRVFLVND